jgi:hypothetical protein
MKMVKKIGAIVLVIMMIAMSTSAMALDTNEEGTGASGTALTEFVISKEIVLFNTAGEPIYEPNINYIYGIAVQDPSSATITDKYGMTGTVKTGVSGLVKIQGSDKTGYTGTAGVADVTLVFGDDNSTKKPTVNEGTTITKDNAETAVRNMKLTFDTTVLGSGNPISYPSSAAGIYRFKITDKTTDAALTAAGIARNSNYDKERYLDVYVEWTDDTRTALQVYGIVLYKTDDSENKAEGDTSFSHKANEETGVKVTGYNVESEMLSVDGTTNSTADEYHTYNLSVTKTTTGTMADKNHEFPVGIIFKNDNVTSQADFYSTGDFANNNLTLTTAGEYSVNTNFTANPKVKNGDTFTFFGLPAGTYYQIAEKNDTVDSYKVKIEDKTPTEAVDVYAEAIVASGANTTVNNRKAIDNLVSAGSYKTQDIQITNTLDAISPTGYVTRFAPYALILVAGIVLLIIATKHKKHTDEE